MTAACRRIHPHLPVFRVDDPALHGCADRPAEAIVALYTPGRLATVNRAAAEALEQAWRTGDDLSPGRLTRLAADLAECASETNRAWQRLVHGPAEARCLTLHLGTGCNLACAYCFGARGHAVAPPPAGVEPARIAARHVARTCARLGEPFHVVVHGHGEPTRSWPLLVRYEALTAEAAHGAGTRRIAYVATNGVLPEARATWLAQHFDRVGVSCDGPPHVHDRLRPHPDGRPTSAAVERTARAVLLAGGTLEVRTTIVPETAARQTEILEYLHHVLGARRVRFEPVFRAPRPWSDEAIDAFVEGFVAARRRAVELGCSLDSSGARPYEVHGPYCDPLQRVLRLAPSGHIPSCFIAGVTAEGRPEAMVLGHVGEAALALDGHRADALRQAAGRRPSRCSDCVNQCHCARDCPDTCPVSGGEPDEPGARCRISRRLTLAWIVETASRVAANPGSVEVRPPGSPGSGSGGR